MVNYIWAFMFLIGFVYAAVTGRMAAINEAIFKSAEEGVVLCLGLIFILIFWLGIMKIALIPSGVAALPNPKTLATVLDKM